MTATNAMDLGQTAHKLRRIGWKLWGLGFLIHQDSVEELLLDHTARNGLGVLVEDLGAEVAQISVALDEESVKPPRRAREG